MKNSDRGIRNFMTREGYSHGTSSPNVDDIRTRTKRNPNEIIAMKNAMELHAKFKRKR